MARSIYKEAIPIADRQVISAPVFSKFLTAQMQPNVNVGRTVHSALVSVWFEVPTDIETKVDYDIRMYGTGHALPDKPGDYLGTVQLAGGELVFHVYNHGPVFKENGNANSN